MEFLQLASEFSASGFMPHGHCYLWQPPLVWAHFLSDLLIALAYFVIAIALYSIIRHIRIPFSGLVLAFGLFIAACGATHLFEVWNLWHADYWQSAAVKVVTAFASVATGVGMIRLRPKIFEVAQAARLADLRRLELENLARTLEARVNERTEELERSRKEAENLARNLTEITDALPSLISYINPDYRYRMANAEYERWYGVKRSEIVGHTIMEIGGENFSQVEPYLKRAFAGEEQSFEIEFSALEKRRKIARVAYVPARDAHGNVVGVITLATDLTELTEAKRRAEEANRAKSAFLANMSHEIRTPLGAILGFTELMSDPNLDRGERLHYAEIVKRNGRQLSNIINDILDLSKVEAGRLEIEHVRFSIVDLLVEVAGSFRALAEKKGLKLNLFIDESLPTVIVSDPLRIRQILTNVIGNAVKFTRHGTIEIFAGIKSHAEHAERAECQGRAQLSILISDTGIGISKESEQRLFQSFMQADSSTTRQYGGSGLGLVLSRSLARSLGGDLNLVRSEQGGGSVFELTCDIDGEPTHQVAAPEGLPRRAESATAEPERTDFDNKFSGRRILVAEDSPDNQLLIRKVLAPTQAELDFVGNGQDAVLQSRARSYDAILMDIQMPLMDGYEATRLIRAAGYRGPIIALTAHALADEKERTRAAGCDFHVTKPISREALIHALDFGFLNNQGRDLQDQ